MERDIKVFGESYLDTDSDPKINKGSDYILNSIIQSDGRFSVIVNIKGNELITDTSLLNSTFPNINNTPIKVVASCVDQARNRIIYFLCNQYVPNVDGYDNAIFYYDILTGENKVIIHNDLFKINYTTKITASIIGDLLLWADGDYIKEINYIRAYNYTNSISTTYKYSNIDSDVVRFYKKPYDGVINLTGNVGGTKLLAGKSFQFATRYTYNSYEKSVLSQMSDIFWCDRTFLSNGKGDITSYDSITLGFTIPTNKDILRTEIFVRNNELSNWYLYDTITTTGTISYTFDNSKLTTTVDQNEISIPYDFIPKTTNTLEVIEKDKLLVADITENFDPTIVDVTVSNEGKSITWSNSPSTTYWKNDVMSDPYYAYFTLTSFDTTQDSFIVLHIPLKTFIRNSIPNFAFPDALYLPITEFGNYIPGTGDIYLVYNATSSSTVHDIMTYFLNQLKTIIKGSLYGDFALLLVSTSGHTNVIKVSKIATVQNPANFNGNDSIMMKDVILEGYSPSSSIKSIKNADSYLGGIVYYDRDLRYSTVNKFSNPITTIHSGLDAVPSYFKVSIKNLPPAWAYYYTLAFTKRIKTGFFIQLKITTQDFFWGEDGYLKIRVQNIINYAHDLNKKCNIPAYTYENGDRIRFLKDGELDYTFDIIGEEYPQDDNSYVKDYSTNKSYILDANGNKIYNTSSAFVVVTVKSTDVLWFNIASTYTEFFVEIYKTKKFSEQTYYYHDKIHPIGSPGTTSAYHIGDTQNQSPTNPTGVPAIVNSNFGDCYYKQRFMKYVFPCVDDSFSDFYDSNFYGLKNPNVYNQDATEDVYESGIRYGGSYVEDSKLNQLNKFKSENLEILKSKFGTINSLKEVGNVLKVLQDRKETSIYISRTEMENADGTSNVVKSTPLLGTANIMNEDRGTIFPKSVVLHNRELYYFDVYRAEVIRTSSNGQFPISEYGMRTYFKSKSKDILSAGIVNTDVLAEFDEQNKIYLLTFIVNGNYETIGFYDPQIEGIKPRWISFFSFNPEHYASLGTTLLSFKNGLGYKHNSDNVNRCTFYGVKYKQQVNWYSNANAIIKKVFKSLRIKSNKPWSVPLIIIEPDASYIRGMQSKLNSNHFELKEGQYFASYLNNMLTTSASPSVLDLFNGDSLRGFYLKHQMENIENAEVWLMDTEINYDVSNYN